MAEVGKQDSAWNGVTKQRFAATDGSKNPRRAMEGFIGSYDRRCFQPLAYFLICTVCLAAILFEYVLYCTLTYILAGQVFLGRPRPVFL